MKFLAFVIAVSMGFSVGQAAPAAGDCRQGIKAFFDTIAPKTSEIQVSGTYTKPSKDGTFKACSLSIVNEDVRLKPKFTSSGFNPGYGDGKAFWPFGTYPTFAPVTSEYEEVLAYDCSADENGFIVEYRYQSKSGFQEKKHYMLSVVLTPERTYDVSLRDGDGGLPVVTCRGSLSEK